MMSNPNDFTLFDTIKLAWNKVKGSKRVFWPIILVIIFFDVINAIAGNYKDSVLFSLIGFIASFIAAIFTWGLLYIGIQRAFDRPIQSSMVKRALQFSIIIRMIGLIILIYLILLPGLIMLMAPLILLWKMEFTMGASIILVLISLLGLLLSIYLSLRLSMAQCFVLTVKANPILAIKASFQVTKNRALQLLGILCINLLIFIGSILTLGIALIWTIPYAFINFGEIYKKLIENTPYAATGEI